MVLHCGVIVPGERFETDIAGLRDQDSAEACFEVLHIGWLLIEMGERPGETGALHHLEKNVRDPAFRHQVANLVSQCSQAVRLGKAVKPGHGNPALSLFGLESRIGVLVCTAGDTYEGLIQKIDKSIDLGLSVECVAQRTAHHALGILPCLPLLHANARVCMPDARHCKDIPPLDGPVPGIDGCEDIGLGVGDLTVIVQHAGLPGSGDHGGRSVLHGGTVPVRLFAQPDHGLGNCLSARCRL